MNPKLILPLDDAQATLSLVGGKGASLAQLAQAGFPVPGGFHVTTMAYRQFVSENDLHSQIMDIVSNVDPAKPSTLEIASKQIRIMFDEASISPAISMAIIDAYAQLNKGNLAVAVRSSATAEDLPEASFAGQQDSFLNVRGEEALLSATKKCWSSLWTARAIGYRARQDIPNEQVALAVVVQELIPADSAGILFTANPINGERTQAVISASWGLGEAVVGGLVTPDSFTVDHVNSAILERQIANKESMTIRVAAGTEEQSVPEDLRRTPSIKDEHAIELSAIGTQIEELYGTPMDIEWTLYQNKLAIVQARPITVLPEPVAPVPNEWPMPDPKGRYMRVSICELLPDPVTPLYDTLGLDAINRGIGVLCKEMFNVPEDLLTGFIMTINGYAYEQVSFTPKQWWLLLSRMVPRFPAMLKEGVPYWQEKAHPLYQQSTDRWNAKALGELSATELLTGVREIMDAFGQHLGALMASTMGPTAGSEGLFTNVYEKRVQKDGEPSAPTFLMGFDNIPLQGEKSLYDLAVWSRESRALAEYLRQAEAEQVIADLAGSNPPAEIESQTWSEFQRRFQAHLQNYGYAIYDMDFAKPLPMDEPAPILEMLKLFIDGQARNPYQRQSEAAERRQQAMETVEPRLKGIKRWAYKKTLNWAQKQAPLREDGLAEIGLGYPILRRMLFELGGRLAEQGAIEVSKDIFWLKEAELEGLVSKLDNGAFLENMTQQIRERKTIWRGRKLATPPSQLPEGKSKYMGFEMEAHLAGGRGGPEGNTIKGVPTSPGVATATARVLHGPEDFDQMQPGDILVAGITTPAWTPLFAMAAGVVTDIGGPLSHGSIVAREYGIPAVLGTGAATRVIQSGQTITIDGNEGIVTLLNADPLQ